MTRAHLSNMAYEVGRLVDLKDEPSVAADATTCARLYRLGYSTCSVHDGPIDALAAAPVAELFERDPDLARRIDAVVLARRTTAFNIVPTLQSAGVGDVPIVEVGGMNCANLACGIVHAAALVKSGTYRNILCAFACKVEPGETRLAGFGLSVIGDGAACCVVSAEGGELEIVDVSQATSLSIYARGEAATPIQEYFPLCRRTFASLCEGKEAPPGGFDHLVSANFPLAVDLLSKLIGRAYGRPYRDSIASIAHISSGDLLINLKQLYDKGGRGDILLSAIAPHSVCMIHLRA